MTAIEAFRAVMRQSGLDWAGDIVGDGELHRFTPAGDKSDNGWYVLHAASIPVTGLYGCWKRQLNEKWHYRNGDDKPLDGRDLAQARIRWSQAQVKRDREEAARHERGAVRAQEFVARCGEATLQHGYLVKKKAGIFGPARLSPAGELVLPLADADGKVWSYQAVDADGSKLFMTAGRVAGCFYTVCDRIDGPLVICEGYATGATLHEASGWAVVCAMNCGNLKIVAEDLRKKHPKRMLVIAADNDRFTQKPNSAEPFNPGVEKAMEAAKSAAAKLIIPEFSDLDDASTDFNDLAATSGLNAVLTQLEKACPSPLSLLSFDQIMIIPHSEQDRILGDHILDRGSSLTLLGAGGAGKSRLALQLIAAILGGKERFLNMEIHPGARNLRWLVLQSENSARRLQAEGSSLKRWLGTTWDKFNENVRILTPINEIDTFLNLDNPENLLRLQASLEWWMPDAVLFDSLYDFGIGDLSKDSDMRNSLIALSRLTRFRNPKRAQIILHHARTGQAGAAGSIGYDRSSFGRNSKVIYNWTRAQINVASMNEDNNEQLAISCGKCSDGREFQPFSARLNTETMIYECDPTVDVKAWSDEMKGRNKVKPMLDSEEVATLCQPAMTRSQLAKSIQERMGCGKTSAFRYIIKAMDRTIKESDGKLFKK